MSEKFIDVSFMKRTEIVQAIRNAESLDKALTLMNGFAANGWLHLWDNAKHPDGSSVQSQWQSSQQAEIERLKGQRLKLLRELKWTVTGLDEYYYDHAIEKVESMRALIAEIEAEND